MTKAEIIDELMVVHEVRKCGYTREQLDSHTKEWLEKWLGLLEDDS